MSSTREIMTKDLGPCVVDERQIFHFPQGLVGLEDFRNFALLDSPRKPFFHLQSLDEVSVAFILIQPEIFTQDYDPRPESQDMAVLEVEDPEDLLVFAIVTAPPQGVLTANLQGPVYLNKKRCLGKQIVSAREIYRTRHNILEEMARKKAATC